MFNLLPTALYLLANNPSYVENKKKTIKVLIDIKTIATIVLVASVAFFTLGTALCLSVLPFSTFSGLTINVISMASFYLSYNSSSLCDNLTTYVEHPRQYPPLLGIGSIHREKLKGLLAKNTFLAGFMIDKIIYELSREIKKATLIPYRF